ncbi:MAG: hypothetical protein EAZ99_03490 [Alphaproteobacteria bacterium]|nr:nuclear transport factor 2 family protein [Alphaproteobacteria bacterium]TAD91169.1 MAG: hypothetical protein EAZ99_03490 [Alphaproteobacteria bacterium]
MTPDERLAVREVYDAYIGALDDGDYEAWPGFFLDPCRYRVTAAENWDRGLPLSLIACESVAMLEDRVTSLRRTQMFAPRRVRHFLSAMRIRRDGDAILVRANFLMLHSIEGEPTAILATGRLIDRLIETADGLRFQEKIAVYDSPLIPNSLIVPV